MVTDAGAAGLGYPNTRYKRSSVQGRERIVADNVRWGVLSTADIGVAKVIPAMQRSTVGAITAIASRDLEKA